MQKIFSKDWIVKLLCITMALISFTAILASCSSPSDNAKEDDNIPVITNPSENKTESETTMDKDIYIVDTLEDKNGNVIQKTVFNAVTKHTYIYTFSYESNAWGVVCKDSGVVIITEDGTIISPDTLPEIPEVPAK